MAEQISAMDPALVTSIINLGQDLFSVKLYWVAISALWFYDYFLTLPDEIKYGWKGPSSAVFWLYIINRYFGLSVVIITLVSYFLKQWTNEVLSCVRYSFMDTLESLVTTSIAEIILTLRVYALWGKAKVIPIVAGFFLLAQWILSIYGMSKKSPASTNQVALLLDPMRFPFPELPKADPYHVCFFISGYKLYMPIGEAWLSVSLAFDGIIFLAIIYFLASQMRGEFKISYIIRIIRNDGTVYFFVLFASNFTWLVLVLYARPALKLINARPGIIISCIMINRITLNLKKAAAKRQIMAWGIDTFAETLYSSTSQTITSMAFQAGNTVDRIHDGTEHPV